MFRRSSIILSKAGRTIVRDPRKRSVPAVSQANRKQQQYELQEQQQQHRQPLPFEPTVQNQQSVGSTLGSYVVMGAGVSLGFAVVGAIFGGF